MKAIKCLGIWMDHSKANLIEYKEDATIQLIESEFTYQKKLEALNNSESGMHRKEEQKNAQFYKSISEEIIKYNKVLLFGPTNAKLELHNFLMKDDHFKEIEITVQGADKMTDNEQIGLVKAYYNMN